MPWPSHVSSATNFNPTLVNTWIDALNTAQGTYNGNGQVSAGWAQLGVTPSAGADAILSTPPALVSAGTQVGGVSVLRANAFDTNNHTRDFGMRVTTTTNSGSALLEFLSRLDGGAWSSVLSADHLGHFGISTSSYVGGLTVVGNGGGLSGTAMLEAAFVQDQTNYRGVYLGYDTSGQIGVIAAASSSSDSALAFYTFKSGSWFERWRLRAGGEMQIPAVAAPSSTPGTGNWFLYIDSADNKLKIKGSAGTVNVIATLTP